MEKKSPLEILTGEINATVDVANKPSGLTRFLCCAECGFVFQLKASALPPKKCPNFQCEKEDPLWGTGADKAAAQERAAKLKGQSVAAALNAGAPLSPELSGASTSTENSSSPGETDGPVSDASTPSSGQEKPKRQRPSRKAPPPSTSPTTSPSSATPGVSTPNQATEDTDWAELRRQAVAALVSKFGLNMNEPTPVGTAVVGTVGYTIWQDKLPIFRFMEPSDTARSFKAEFLEDKTEFPGIEMDVVRCHSISCPEVAACCFKGNLVAATNSGRGTIRVTPGAEVKVGAIQTEKSVRFVVLYK